MAHRDSHLLPRTLRGAVYPGVDLLFYGNRRQLEYDFVVAPHADPSQIRLHFAGADRLRLNAAGDLILHAADGQVAFHNPVVYQQRGGQRQSVAGRFTLLADNTIGFTIGSYDRAEALVIDPTLAYSTYLGGDSNSGDSASAIAVDAEGNAYLTGQTEATNFPLTSPAVQTTNEGAANSTFNAFVTKLNAGGTALVYSTYLGGSANTRANAIAVDSTGAAYVTGQTSATNFPTTTGVLQTATKASSTTFNAFVSKLSTAGTALTFSTYLGGSGNGNGTGDFGNAIAVDASGDVYVAGQTYSSNFPVSSGAHQSTNNAYANASSNAFITKLNSLGSALVYSTYLGGAGAGMNGNGDSAFGIALDSSDDVYVTGSTASAAFPTTSGAYQTTNKAVANEQTNAFVTKLNPTGTPIYSTFLGGSKNASGYAIAVDSSGYAYVAGTALYTDFPVTSGVFQTANNASSISATNAFVAKINLTGTALVYSTWLGGSGLKKSAIALDGDSADAIAVDASGDAYVAGLAYSTNFPTTSGAYQTKNAGATNETYNAFFTELNPTATALLYSTYLGGAGVTVGTTSNYIGDNATAIALDSAGNVYMAGTAYSTNFPVTSGAFQSSNGASAYLSSNAFATKLALAPATATTTSVTSSANPQVQGSAVTFSATVAPASGSIVPTGTVAFSVDGTTASTVTLNASGVATYSTSTLSGTSHTIVAVYNGSATYLTSTSTALTQTITPPAATPTFSVAAGTYITTQSVTLADTTPGATIYYTTNGTTPTVSSTVYSGAISVSATETVEAIAVATGYTTSATASAKYTITPPAATPTFSVAAGTYITTQSVTLADTTTGATIYYTTNGATPTTSSTKYTAAISVSATETIKAIAVATNYSTSATASAAYTITPPAATPTFSVAAGTYTSTQTVTLADTTTGASIYYTTNGTTPTTSSTKYTAAISVSATETIEAIALATNYSTSATASATYTITPPAATPTFSVAAGTYTTTQSVTLADTTTGATIYYTTNGTTPTTSSTKYSSAISVSATETIKAIAVATGYSTSATASAAYTITPPAATPTFSVAAGTYTTTQSVTLADTTTGATIYYTTNGTTPTTSSTKYTAAISVSATETIEAIAVATGYSTSATASAAYTITPPAATPTFSVAAGTYTSTQTVTLADTTTGATIYYTTNGTTPTTSSTKYTAAISVSATETIEAIAVATGYSTSATASAAYTITPPAATPTFSVAAGTYTSTQTVTLADTTTGATIYYTTNGTTPTTSSTKYTAAISVSATETIEAIAVATGYSTSAVASAAYTIGSSSAGTAKPAFSVPGGTYATAQTVKLLDSTSGATIYYLTNGQTPTTSSIRYSAPLTVSKSETVEAVAIASGHTLSPVATASYTIKP